MMILSVQEGDSEGWDWNEIYGLERYFARYQRSEMNSMLAHAGFEPRDVVSSVDISKNWLLFVCIGV